MSVLGFVLICVPTLKQNRGGGVFSDNFASDTKLTEMSEWLSFLLILTNKIRALHYNATSKFSPGHTKFDIGVSNVGAEGIFGSLITLGFDIVS